MIYFINNYLMDKMFKLLINLLFKRKYLKYLFLINLKILKFMIIKEYGIKFIHNHTIPLNNINKN